MRPSRRVIRQVTALASAAGLIMLPASAWASTALGTEAPSNPPENLSAPTISGPLAVGATVQALAGTWQNVDAPFSYQWYVCAPSTGGCVAVPSATDASFAIPAGANGGQLMVAVTATGTGGVVTLDSPVSASISSALGAPAVISRPAILGRPTVGSTVTASTLSAPGQVFTGSAPLRYGYEWWTCSVGCDPVFGARGPTLRVTAADIGHELAYTVTATNAAGTSTAASPLSTTVPAPAATLRDWLMPLVSVSGRGGRLAALRDSGAYVTSFNAAVVGRAAVVWSAAERIGGTMRRVAVATATARITFTAPRTRVRITLTPAGRALLRHRTTVRLTGRVRFVFAYGTGTRSTTLSAPLTLR